MPTPKDFLKFVENLPLETINDLNLKQLERTKKEYAEFISRLDKNECYLCGTSLDDYKKDIPCLHWLLRPNKIKQKLVVKAIKSKSYGQINSYLKWLANAEIKFQNINNLVAERNSNKVIEETIKYKKIQWAFSCSKTDLKGHVNKNHGTKPHFHFEMRINDKIFIKFNKYHFDFTEKDLCDLYVLEKRPEKFKAHSLYGMGMQDLFDENIDANSIIDNTRKADDYQSATFEMQTLLMAPKGKTISGDKIADILKKHKNTGIPLAKLVQSLNVHQQTLISPGEGVIKMSQRTKRK